MHLSVLQFPDFRKLKILVTKSILNFTWCHFLQKRVWKLQNSKLLFFYWFLFKTQVRVSATLIFIYEDRGLVESWSEFSLPIVYPFATFVKSIIMKALSMITTITFWCLILLKSSVARFCHLQNQKDQSVVRIRRFQYREKVLSL